MQVRAGFHRQPTVLALVLVAGACAARQAPQPTVVETAPLPVETAPRIDGKPRFERGLEQRLRSAPAGKRFEVLVDLTRQVDYPALAARLLADSRPKRVKREAVIRLIERIAAEQQRELAPAVDRLTGEGRLDYVAPVAIVNRLVVEGSAEGILALADEPQVAGVLAEWRSEGQPAQRSVSTPGVGLGEQFTSWGITAVGADRLWAEGLDGSGVVVAALDSGAFAEHEQLAGRQLPGSRGWYDPVQGTSQASDNHGHGTAVLSIAVGGNPDGRYVGIAPGARWAMGLANWRNRYSRVRMTLAADWLLRTARPDVVVNAWSHDEGPCSDFDLPFINAWKAAGIFVVFPAGNAGPESATGEAPAQLAGTIPHGGPVFSVAALAEDGRVAPLSSRGPSACGDHPFPSLAVPGAALPHAIGPATDAYSDGSGTSYGAGLLAGAAALLIQAEPELQPWELEEILLQAVRDIPPAGHDDQAGAGALDLSQALRALRDRRGTAS